MSLILDLIFPKYCYGCSRSGSYLCPECSSKIDPKPIVNLGPQSPLESCLSLFPYRGFIKNMLSDLKYSFVSDLLADLIPPVAAGIASNYPNLLSYWRQNQYVLVPVPLHWQRQNWRGFNQSALISAALADYLKLGYCSDLIIRTKSTLPQASLSLSSQRLLNVSQSFCLNSRRLPLTSSRVILVDDVATTHATLRSCAAVLQQYSFKSTWGLTLAGGH